MLSMLSPTLPVFPEGTSQETRFETYKKKLSSSTSLIWKTAFLTGFVGTLALASLFTAPISLTTIALTATTAALAIISKNYLLFTHINLHNGLTSKTLSLMNLDSSQAVMQQLYNAIFPEDPEEAATGETPSESVAERIIPLLRRLPPGIDPELPRLYELNDIKEGSIGGKTVVMLLLCAPGALSAQFCLIGASLASSLILIAALPAICLAGHIYILTLREDAMLFGEIPPLQARLLTQYFARPHEIV